MDSSGYLTVLPRGRHRLTREEVAASQRGRLLLGMAESVAEKGYAAATVADVLKRVHVSRETFYQHFSDKADCFLAAYDQAAEMLEAGVRRAMGPPETPALERFDRALTAYLELLAGEPALARTFLIEVHVAGPALAERRLDVQRHWSRLFADLLAADERWRRLPDAQFAAAVVVSGLGSLVTRCVASGDLEHLPGLRKRALDLIRAFLPENEDENEGEDEERSDQEAHAEGS